MGWLWVLWVCVGALFVFLFFLLNGRILRVWEAPLPIARLPKKFFGAKILLLSDLHDRAFRPDELEAAVRRAAPDYIFLAGDMHGFMHEDEPYFRLLYRLRQIAPVYAVEGNHDLRPDKTDPARYRTYEKVLEKLDIVLLDDRSVLLRREDETLLLRGLTWRSSRLTPPPVPDAGEPSLLLCHDPSVFDRLSSLPDVIFCGHVHGGMVRLPFLGPVFAPGCGRTLRQRFRSRECWFPKYYHGLYRKGSRLLAVTQGLGVAVIPFRFLAPELMLLTLQAAEQS